MEFKSGSPRSGLQLSINLSTLCFHILSSLYLSLDYFRNGPVCDTVEGKYPNVYTDVSHFIDWIETNTGINYQLNVFLHRQA